MKKIRPFLWFDDKAEEASNFYVSIFKNSRILDTNRYGDAGPGDPGKVMSVNFELDGEEFIALNGGPHFSFTPAISFFVSCKTQAEVDEYWDKLLEGGHAQQCGWLTDKYGLSWQIVPEILGDLLADPDEEKSDRVMRAMLEMIKLDIGELQAAAQSTGALTQ